VSEFTFTIPGGPVPKGRPRLGKGHVYTPKKTKDYEQKVAALCLMARRKAKLKPFEGPVEVAVMVLPFAVQVTVREMDEGEVTRTDLDNVCKAALDGMNGVAYKDDRQVLHLEAWK